MNLKPVAVQIVLQNGETLLVRTPRMRDLPTFFKAMPFFSQLAKGFEAIEAADSGIMGVPVNIDESVIVGVAPLFAVMTDITVEQFLDMGFADGFAVLTAFGELMPKNPEATPEKTSPESTS